MHFSTLLLPIVSVVAQSTFHATDDCPLLGPTFSSNFDLAKTESFSAAVAAFPEKIATLIAAGAISNSSTFVIDVFSTVTNTSLYTYTYEAEDPKLNQTTVGGRLNDQTIFRIGSVSKLFTVYSILAHSGGLSVFDEPVTKYIPELAGNYGKDPASHIIFENVTIGHLASHQAGTGQFPIKLLGSPCRDFTEPGCLLDTYYNIMRDGRRPSQPIAQASLYSDNGFGILGRALESMTNMTYEKAVQKILGQALHLNSTTTFAPTGKDLNAVVISEGPGLSSWGYDNQLSAPSGGIYSSAADLRAIGTSILNSELLSSVSTRGWMKPKGLESSIVWAVGAPWEINRLTLPVSANSTRTRISDLYTKSGGQAGYGTLFALSPDHKIGYSVLVAGPAALQDRWTLRAIAGQSFVVAAEHAGRKNAALNFAGTFIDPTNSTTNLTLSIAEDRPALNLDSLYVLGFDVRFAVYSPDAATLPPQNLTVQLYPTNLNSRYANGSQLLTYRGVGGLTPAPPRALIDGGSTLFDDSCISWFNTAFNEDTITDTGEFYDTFLLVVEDGKLIKVILPSVNVTMERVA